MGTLRFLLALSVILFHVNVNGFQLVGGGVAVETFFIISGFYMSLVLDTKYTGENGSYRLFITNRLLKLYPAYWTVLALAVIMQVLVWLFTGYPPLVLHQVVHFKMNAPGVLFLGFSNIALLGHDLIAFFGLNKATGALYFTKDFLHTYPMLYSFTVIPQGWSLGVELWFYLSAPFLVRRKWYWVTALIAASLFLRFYLTQVRDLRYDPWVFRFFPSQLVLFLAGNIAYRLYRYLKNRVTITALTGWVVLAAVVAATCVYDQLEPSVYRKTVYHIMIILALPVLLPASSRWKFDNQLGELSYPVYLCHMLVLQTVRTINSQTTTLQWIPVTLLTIVLTIVLSWLVNRFVVQPVNSYRQSRLSLKKNRAQPA